MFVSRLVRYAVPAAVGLVLGVGAASALTLPTTRLEPPSTPIEAVQYQGAAQTHQYRRAMRHYRNNPGARFELRQNRTIYCRKRPSRC